MLKFHLLIVTFLLFLLAGLSTKAQPRIGDPGVTFDSSKLDTNYPQMAKWMTAGVRGGIPFMNQLTIKDTLLSGATSDDIIQAIAEVAALGGGTVLLKNGTYTIDKQVNMASNVSLLGESRNGVKCMVYMGGQSSFYFPPNVNKSGIYRLTIEGSWGEPTYNWNYGLAANDELVGNDNILVKFKDSEDCWLDQVNLINSARDPMRCNATHTTFRDLIVYGAHRKAGGAQGYFFIQNAYNLVSGCQITNLRHISLQGPNVEYNVVYDNNFHQEISFHTGDNGNNLIEHNKVILPFDMPPVAVGDADAVTPVEARNDKPVYFAIMGPWSTQHTNSANPNFLMNNQCKQLNHEYGCPTPWSQPGILYTGPKTLGLTIQQRIDNFPAVVDSALPKGGTLYPVIAQTVYAHLTDTTKIACDDGDPCTIDDYYDTNCNCVGRSCNLTPLKIKLHNNQLIIVE